MNVSYERKDQKEDWLTPPHIIKALGPFDLDPCFSEPRPWGTADNYYTKEDDGLILSWHGFVWCNPPYGRETKKWLEKCSEYKNCLALIFARTDTVMFHEYIWSKAYAIMFLKGRIAFHRPDGSKGQSAGAASCIVAWNWEGYKRLIYSGLEGKIVKLNNLEENGGVIDNSQSENKLPV